MNDDTAIETPARTRIRRIASRAVTQASLSVGKTLGRLRPPRPALVSALLCAPLAIFLVCFFVVPVLLVMHTALHNPVIGEAWPGFVTALRRDREVVPGEEAFRALARAIAQDEEAGTRGRALKPFSQQDPDLWRLLQDAAARPPPKEFPSAKAWFIAIDPAWAEPETWLVIRRVAAPYTTHYLVDSLDARLTPQGTIRLKPEERRGYARVLAETLGIGVSVSLICLLLGYPLAYRLATMPPIQARIGLHIVLLPLWGSVLVKTFAFMAILDRQGIMNSLGTAIGWIDEPVHVYPSRGALVATMVYVMLPFMVLPVYYRMRNVSIDYLRAAVSLGASPARAVLTGYLPHTMRGIASGCLLVFVLTSGYYVVPALTAEAKHRTVSMLIVEFATTIVNDGMAAAMASLLLGVVLALCTLYVRSFGPIRLRSPARMD